MPHLVETPADLAALAAAVRRAGRVAFDLETNGLHAYRSRVCCLQFGLDGGVAVVDALAVAVAAGGPLGAVLADPAVEKILHGASHDVASLKDDLGIGMRGVFDTYVAATLLGRPRVGLADLVEEVAGVRLSKALQKCDWGARPLTPEMLAYLASDVVHLPAVADRLRADLAAAGIEEEAEIEFRRVEETPPTGTAFDPLGYLGAKGAADLDDRALAILRELWLERDRIAREIDRPTFKVLADGALVGLAGRAARSRRPGRAVEGFRALRTDRLRPHVGRLAAALERGAAAGRIPEAERPENRPRRPAGPLLSRAEREALGRRLEALRAWRREEAKRRGLPPMTILPNPVLDEIARRRPASPEGLAATPGLGRSRAARYGPALLSLLAEARAQG